MTATDDDRRQVEVLIGRVPQGDFEVVVRTPDGVPMVIRNAPLLDDGTPMPTRYWLVDRELNRRIGTVESVGGVRRSEAELDPAEVAAAHQRYAAERDAALPAGWTGPTPSGGVGGTRTGVKCLHAHYAWYLAGGDDPVGRWTDEQLRQLRSDRAPVDLTPVDLTPVDLTPVDLTPVDLTPVDLTPDLTPDPRSTDP